MEDDTSQPTNAQDVICRTGDHHCTRPCPIRCNVVNTIKFSNTVISGKVRRTKDESSDRQVMTDVATDLLQILGPDDHYRSVGHSDR